MANIPRDNNGNQNAPGFQGPDEFPTMEDAGEKSEHKKAETRTRSDMETDIEREKKRIISRRRFLIFAGILGLAAVASYEVDKQRESEIRKKVDQMLEQIDLSELINIQNSGESEAVEKLREALEAKGYKEDSASDNLLSPKLVEVINKANDDLMDEDLEELPEACGRYEYNKYEMDIDEPFKLRDAAAAAFKRADEKLFKEKGVHIKISRAFSVNMQQNDLFIAKEKDPSRPPAAPPGHSLHEAGLAVDVANHHIAKKYLLDEGFYWLGNWKLNEKHHFQWGVGIKESMWMEGLYEVSRHINVKKGKQWLQKGQKKLDKGIDWVKKQL